MPDPPTPGAAPAAPAKPRVQRAPRPLPQFDVNVMVGLFVIGVVSGLAILRGGDTGLTVAAGGIGGIAGWLTKATLGGRATTEAGDVNINPAPPPA